MFVALCKTKQGLGNNNCNNDKYKDLEGNIGLNNYFYLQKFVFS